MIVFFCKKIGMKRLFESTIYSKIYPHHRSIKLSTKPLYWEDVNSIKGKEAHCAKAPGMPIPLIVPKHLTRSSIHRFKHTVNLRTATLILTSLFALASAQAIVLEWTGNSDNSIWGNTNNWNETGKGKGGDGIPNNSDEEVKFKKDVDAGEVISLENESYNIEKLTVETDTSFTLENGIINSAGELKVKGGGTLTLDIARWRRKNQSGEFGK